MPTYVFRCAAGHEFEEVRKVADRNAEAPCMHEHCGRMGERVAIPSGKAPAYVTRPGVGDRSPFSRDRIGK